MKLTIGIADDHALFLKSLASLINNFNNCSVIVEGNNGQHLLDTLKKAPVLPDILLIDVEMPVMDGIEASKHIAESFPAVKMIALSMKDDDDTILGMIRNGCCAYLLKDIHPYELEKALHEVHTKGYYNGDVYNLNYRRIVRNALHKDQVVISDREQTFLQLACSDLTYKEIAAKMNLAERTIDGYREALFGKLNVQSRVGMVLEALKLQLVALKNVKR